MVEWAALVPASLIVAATPGANQILALRNGVRAGTTTAILASLGRFAAFILMVIAVAIGLAAVLGTSRVVFEILKWTGVAYLAWLGVRALRDGSRVREPTRKEHPTLRPSRLARQEFLVAMANPKALILFTVFLPQFVLSGTATAPALLAAGMAYIAIEFACACAYAAIGGHIGVNGLTRRARRTMDRLTGGAMLGLAGWLATEKQA
jgi:homoserine/homoserine lactone efflux protein